jgi:hypothetical protein
VAPRQREVERRVLRVKWVLQILEHHPPQIQGLWQAIKEAAEAIDEAGVAPGLTRRTTETELRGRLVPITMAAVWARLSQPRWPVIMANRTQTT